jgi:cation/acetate symporter
MATGADWMSAASFIGMAGTLYLTGYGGLAFIMGWTGGYCLVALFLAPYLRKFGQFTIPDFLGARYEGNLPRLIGILAAILCSFTYVVAQIYGVGLITTRLSGLAFEIGIFVGLGGILVCSFLGGMRAVTWTQVAQYIILIIAYMIPVVWLSVKQTGVPIPQAIYGYQLQKVTAAGEEADRRPEGEGSHRRLQGARRRVRRQAEGRAGRAGCRQGRRREEGCRPEGRQRPGGRECRPPRRRLAAVPKDESRRQGRLGQGQGHNEPCQAAGRHATARGTVRRATRTVTRRRRRPSTNVRRNFLALVFCLMVGTAALPHILMRYYTTPSVKEARESVTWSLFFIFLLYFTAPALAVLVKYEVFSVLVGTPFDKLPAWISPTGTGSTRAAVGGGHQQGRHLPARRDEDRRRHHRAGHAGNRWPALRGLGHGGRGRPGGGAVHRRRPAADDRQRAVARPVLQDDRPERADRAPRHHLQGAAAGGGPGRGYVAAQKPADILFLVSAAFSFAAAAFFPALVLGVFWKRANKWGASLGMIAGLGITFYYMVTTQPWLRGVFGVTSPIELWWGIQPISAGLFGVPLGFAVIIIVSLLTPAPKQETQELVEHVRYPDLRLSKA